MRFRHARVSGPAILSIALPVALAVAACSNGGAVSSGTTSSAGATSEMSAAPSEAAGTPGPTDATQMSIAFLPEVMFDPNATSLTCDPPADASGMSCDDIAALTARIAATISAAAPTSITVERGTDPNVIDVTFVAPGEEDAGDLTFTTTINVADQTVTFPTQTE